MEWIKTEEGYVRSDSIINVYIDYYAQDEVRFLLTNGEPVIYKTFYSEGNEQAKECMEQVIKHLVNSGASVANKIMVKLP